MHLIQRIGTSHLGPYFVGVLEILCRFQSLIMINLVRNPVVDDYDL